VRRLGALAAAVLLLAGCAQDTARLPPAPVPYGPEITVDATPVPLNPSQPQQGAMGGFAWAGGLMLTSAQTSRLHGLSDIKAWPDGRLLAVGDQGDLLEARLVLDGSGRLVDVQQARLTQLQGEDGRELYALGEVPRDAEGILELSNGDRLISFEQDDRILLYPRTGALPRRAPSPDVRFTYNKGMEALTLVPAAGADAYAAGNEETGQTWICRLSAACVADRRVQLDDGFELAGMASLSGGRMAYLLRAFDRIRGVRIVLRVMGADGATLDELRLAAPLTVDNFEGVAAVEQPGRPVRFYLISDDNFADYQRTLLVAFDWRG